jgi:hypothetical protein
MPVSKILLYCFILSFRRIMSLMLVILFICAFLVIVPATIFIVVLCLKSLSQKSSLQKTLLIVGAVCGIILILLFVVPALFLIVFAISWGNDPS